MTTARDVAAYIEQMVRCDALKLHKLLYYSQAWSLAWDGAPLFPETIEAWRDGPVVRSVWVERNYQKALPGDPRNLTEEQRRTIEEVVRFYSVRDSAWLRDFSHMEEPWTCAHKGFSQKERCQQPITLESMASYYGQQASALGEHKKLPASLKLGQDLLMSLDDEEIEELYTDSAVTDEEELRFLEHGGADPWKHPES